MEAKWIAHVEGWLLYTRAVAVAGCGDTAGCGGTVGTQTGLGVWSLYPENPKSVDLNILGCFSQ